MQRACRTQNTLVRRKVNADSLDLCHDPDRSVPSIGIASRTDVLHLCVLEYLGTMADRIGQVRYRTALLIIVGIPKARVASIWIRDMTQILSSQFAVVSHGVTALNHFRIDGIVSLTMRNMVPDSILHGL
jgi:hypothetical protein